MLSSPELADIHLPAAVRVDLFPSLQKLLVIEHEPHEREDFADLRVVQRAGVVLVHLRDDRKQCAGNVSVYAGCNYRAGNQQRCGSIHTRVYS